MSGAVHQKIVHAWLFEDQNFLRHRARWPHTVPLCIDSRTAVKDSIFFAIKGEFADGHDFIEMALQNGAILAIAQENHPKSLQVNPENISYVKDPLQLFSLMSRDHLRSMPARKIALTGSNGKTTTKEMIKSALMSVLDPRHVFASAGNKNNHFGVPLSALEVGPEHLMAVFEMGMNHAGEIAELCKIIEPEVALITNISMAHEGGFADGLAGVQKAKGELFESINMRGHAVINLDDPGVCAEALQRSFPKVTTFGFAPKAHIRIIKREPFSLSNASQKIVLAIENQELIDCEIPLPGLHHAMNAAAALAVIHALGLPVKQAALGLSVMTTTMGRLSLSRHEAGYLIVNDGYNANPASMKAGVEAVLELPAHRRIAVIGAMGELGAKSPEYHLELGKLLATHFQHVLVCGNDALPVLEGAMCAGMSPKNIIFEQSSHELIEPLKKLLASGDLVFIKGSLSANMAAVAKALTAL